MKKISKNLAILSFLTLGSVVFAQDIKVSSDVKNSNDKALIVSPEQIAEQEAKKKAALAEKAKLPKPYDAKANAEKDIENLVAKAKKENKNIMIQAGGNWCIWCLRFNQFVQTTPELKEIVDKNYIYYHLNYSPDNKNEKIFARYIKIKEQQFYPFFIILDKDGKKIHVQQSEILEKDKGYSKEKVKEFLEQWKSL